MRRQTVVLALALTEFCSSIPSGRDIVMLTDMSAGVTAEARGSIIGLIEGVATGLHRGDTFTVIPIRGDAFADTPERIIRFGLSVERQPFDADRELMLAEVSSAATELLLMAQDDPSQHTDVLGSFLLAAEELGPRTLKGRQALIVCLSDAIQDDARFDFKNDSRLGDEAQARLVGADIARAGLLANVQVFLGSVMSTDLKRLPRARRDAVRAFWHEWLEQQGAALTWSSDGVGRLPLFLERPEGRSLFAHGG